MNENPHMKFESPIFSISMSLNDNLKMETFIADGRTCMNGHDCHKLATKLLMGNDNIMVFCEECGKQMIESIEKLKVALKNYEGE